jgi:heme oxygenase
MTISPDQLIEHARNSIDIDAVIEELDARLMHHVTIGDLKQSTTISCKLLPSSAIAEIQRRYRNVGWAYVIESSRTGSFSNLEFGLRAEED